MVAPRFSLDRAFWRTISSKMVKPETRHLKEGDAYPPLKKGLLRVYNMRFCPFAQRALLVLDTKNVPYEQININLGDKPKWFLEKSLGGKVPTIEFENGDTLGESLIISDFLDELYPEKKLWPKDPLAKAKDKVLLERYNELIKAFYQIFMARDFSEEAQEAFYKQIDIIENELAVRKTKFLSGAQPGMVDLMAWPWLERLQVLTLLSEGKCKVDTNRFPKVLQWQKDMIAQPGVQESYLPPEAHYNFAKTRITGYLFSYDMLVK